MRGRRAEEGDPGHVRAGNAAGFQHPVGTRRCRHVQGAGSEFRRQGHADGRRLPCSSRKGVADYEADRFRPVSSIVRLPRNEARDPSEGC